MHSAHHTVISYEDSETVLCGWEALRNMCVCVFFCRVSPYLCVCVSYYSSKAVNSFQEFIFSNYLYSYKLVYERWCKHPKFIRMWIHSSGQPWCLRMRNIQHQLQMPFAFNVTCVCLFPFRHFPMQSHIYTHFKKKYSPFLPNE